MATCCSDSSASPTQRSASAADPALRPRVIALAGNPNSGKTTVFNALTGLRQKVANYPGVTVERRIGRCRLAGGTWIDVIDLPGTYSLISRSPDERIATAVLRGQRPDTPAPDVVVVVVDASNLQRNLYLVSQLIEMGRPLVIALNMTDIAERRGVHVSPQRLAEQIGVPVVPLVGHKKRGIAELKEALARAVVAPMPDWPLPQAMREELLLVGGGLAILDKDGNQTNGNGHSDQPRLSHYNAIAERLLIGDHGPDLTELAAREPVAALLRHAGARLAQLGIDPMHADVEAHYGWIETVAAGATEKHDGAPPPQRTLSDRIDAVLIHRVWGLLIFAVAMAALFCSIFWLAQPLMDGIGAGVNWLANHATAWLAPGPLKSLISDGVIQGVGTVITFVPQIVLLFFFLAIMEDSGYLARAAFLMDRLLAKVGLQGKSFIPLLSSFACAIPGIMAARTIENRKDRLATIFVAPFMGCSARLPVYSLLIGTFFATYSALARGGIMLAMYVLGIVAAVATAFVFKRTFLKGGGQTFILELPTYKLPQPGQVLRQMWSNTSAFLTKAGTTIFCLSILLWAVTYYPRLPQPRADAVRAASLHSGASDDDAANAVTAAAEDFSLAGRFGHAVEPVIRPLGFNWKMGVGLVGAFAAREMFVGTMGIVYSVGKVDDDTKGLSSAMQADRYPDGRLVWRPLVAVSLLVWFVLAMQCMSTVAIVRRETGGWAWPIGMTVYMNALAYVACLVLFQAGSVIFHL